MRIMFVCHGNVCRSALSEYLLRDALPNATVTSSGLLYLEGHPMEQHYVRELASRHIDGTPHKSRHIDDAMVDGNDVILVFTDAQLSEILQEYPMAARKTYLIDDFANLAHACLSDGDFAQATTLGERFEIMQMNEPFKRPTLPRAKEIEDPYGGTNALYTEVAQTIEADIRTIADALTK